jgi:hypothetical protein
MLPAPQLLVPTPEVAMPQDNLFEPCRIFGMDWYFAWRLVPEAIRYQVQVNRADTWLPHAEVDAVVTETSYRVQRCGCMPDELVHNWRWRVRAQAPDGIWGRWSGWVGFQVQPLPTCMHLTLEK